MYPPVGTWNQRSMGSILTRGNILLLDFFVFISKASDANIGIMANFV